MLKTKKINKILSIILLVLTIFSIAQPIFAASGTGEWVGGQYGSKIFTTDSDNSGNGILIRRLINNKTGEKLTVFCAEHGVPFETGTVYNGEYYTPTDSRVKQACKIAYFGWYAQNGGYVVDGGILDDSWAYEVRLSYVFTQQYIWETLGQSNATFIDANIQNRYVAFKNDINNKISNMQRKPSFCNGTVTVEAGETTILTDTNGVLADYTSIDKTTEGIRIVHNKGENTMSITVNDDCTRENYRISDEMMKNWGVIKEESRDNDTTIYFSFRDGIQNQLCEIGRAHV